MRERDIFIDALQLADPEERSAFLERACGADVEMRKRIEMLLGREEREEEACSFLEQPAFEFAATSDVQKISEQLGTYIGPYKLIEQIGEGGMGLVYMARQREPVKRNVALKVIKPGMNSREVVARFEAERQALALMDHPNIARILDGGTTDSGLPFFAMDLVRGMPITEYCDQQHLSTRERLELFTTACQAVQHAHQKGIIHRDLKPSNVMITLHDGTPVPKVIDFGIAKALHQPLTDESLVTGFAQLVGTPMYMSPEQAEMSDQDVDTRSDVYSLGVLLYELLTGLPPFDREKVSDASLDEVRRIIREDEPPRPSTRISTLDAAGSSTISHHRGVDARQLGAMLRGELDWIVMKALEKDRSRRYETVTDLARDIQRYLDDEPVEACPPSRIYRISKFARRNKLVLVSAAVVAASLIAGAGIATWNSVEATRKGDVATQQRRIADQKSKIADRARLEAEQLATLGLEVLDDIYLNVLGDRLARQPQLPAEQRQLLQTGLDYYEQFVRERAMRLAVT